MQDDRSCLLCGKPVDVAKENISATVNSIPVLLHRICFNALQTLAQGDATISVVDGNDDNEQH